MQSSQPLSAATADPLATAATPGPSADAKIIDPYLLTAWGRSGLLNQVVSMYYAQDPGFFNLSQVVTTLNVEFEGKIKNAPIVELSPLTAREVVRLYNTSRSLGKDHAQYVTDEPLPLDPPNFGLSMDPLTISIYEYDNGQRGVLLKSADFTVVTYGIFGVGNGKLVLTSLASKVTGGSGGDDPLVKKIMDGFVLPSLAARVQGMELPQFQGIFGTGLNARIANVTIDKQVFNLFATIAAGAAETPVKIDAAAAPVKIDAVADPANINAYVAGNAINILGQQIIGPQQYNFDQDAGGSFGAAGIRGRINMSRPSISINGSAATAGAGISISAEGGIKLFWTWSWVPLPIPNTKVAIDIALRSNSTDAYIEITGVQSIHVDLGNWPGILSPVKSVIEGLLNAIVGAFRGQISNAVSGTKIKLFDLPATIPGMNVPARLSFTTLQFANSGVTASINVAPK